MAPTGPPQDLQERSLLNVALHAERSAANERERVVILLAVIRTSLPQRTAGVAAESHAGSFSEIIRTDSDLLPAEGCIVRPIDRRR
eukprot:1484775-Pyramimonas_sp.AAC.1